MFSGLIEAKMQIAALEFETSDTVRLTVCRPPFFTDIAIGDSIANSGCCLTVVACDDSHMAFQAGSETLSKTKLGSLRAGSWVNLERSLALGDRLGGHLVSGHVDGLGQVVSRQNQDDWTTIVFAADARLMKQMASKGSITVDGVSLTLVDVTDSTFSVALIPHTLSATTLGELKVGDHVNLETDLLAKYVQRQLEFVTTSAVP